MWDWLSKYPGWRGIIIAIPIAGFMIALAVGIVLIGESVSERRERITQECRTAYGGFWRKGFNLYPGLDVCYTVDKAGVITFLELPEVVEAE